MKCTLEKIIDDVQLLVSRIETRENAADQLRQQIVQLQSDILSMQKYQEEVRSFNELSERLSTHPKGPLIRCLAAENKQLEQLKLENRALCTSLDEHQSALDLIMKKYRSQVTKLMQANQLETALKSSTLSSSNEADRMVTGAHHSNPDLGTAHLVNGFNTTASDKPTTTALSLQMSALAAMAQDVCDRGDAYATELEAELHRLRSENAGLREMLMISSAYSVESSEAIANLDPIPGASAQMAGGGFDRPRQRYMVHNRPSYPLSADSYTPNRRTPTDHPIPVTGSSSRPFGAFSYSASEPHEYHDELSMNPNNEMEDKDDVVTLWDSNDDELDKSYDNQSQHSVIPSNPDQDHTFDTNSD